jgi:hypothetical protein
MTPTLFWSNRFNCCALAAGFSTASEGKLDRGIPSAILLCRSASRPDQAR